jgi:hypothetical protein
MALAWVIGVYVGGTSMSVVAATGCYIVFGVLWR